MSSVVNNSIIISWNQFWIKDRITWLGRLCITPSSAVPCPPVRIWNLGESQFKNWAARPHQLCRSLSSGGGRRVQVQMTLQYLHSSVITRPLSSQICSTHPPTKQHGCFQHCPGIIHKCNYFLDNGDWDWSRRRDREVRAASWQLQYYCNTSKVEPKNLFEMNLHS